MVTMIVTMIATLIRRVARTLGSPFAFVLLGGTRWKHTTIIVHYSVKMCGYGVPHVSVLHVGLCIWLMPEKLKRYYGRGDLHFVTFSCYRRLPLLKTIRARNVFVHALGKIRERYKFMLVGYVVMPDHVHLLMSEPLKVTPSVVLKALKQRVSRDLRKHKRRVLPTQLRLPFMNAGAGLPRFWQPRFYVYSAHKKREKLEYMHANPVKPRLIKNPGAWIWSSFVFYEKGEPGLVPIDPVE